MKDIIPNGSKVTFKLTGIEGLVIGVCARGENNESVEYEIAVSVNGKREAYWVNSFEVKRRIDNSKPMGFSNNNDKPLLGK